MCIFNKSPSIPQPSLQQLPPPVAPPPSFTDPQVRQVRSQNRQAAALIAGGNRGFGTSPLGLLDTAKTTSKTLFG